MTGTVRTARVVVASTLIAVPSVVAVVELERGIPSFTLCNATQLGGFVATSAIGLAVASQRRSREIIEERARRAVESHEAEGRRRVGGERLRIAQELTT